MRRKPQLGAEPRQEDEDEKREEQFLFPFPAKEESSKSWTRITERREAIQPSTTCLFGSHQACLLLCLSRSISLNFFSFVPFGRGVHAPGLGSQGGERASNMHNFPLGLKAGSELPTCILSPQIPIFA